MIKTFANKLAENLFHGRSSKETRKFPHELHRRSELLLDALNAATELQDMASPPGNRLEKLSGELQDKYSVRINDQWRIVFRFENGNAHEVEILDYH
jgi:proteic killer suppression protein